MKLLSLYLVIGNTFSACVLLAIPIIKWFGLAKVEVPPSAVYGWFLVFLPVTTALAALVGIRFSRPSLRKPWLVQTAAALGFLSGSLGVLAGWSMYQAGRFDLLPFASAVALLGWLNVLVLGRTILTQSRAADSDHGPTPRR